MCGRGSARQRRQGLHHRGTRPQPVVSVTTRSVFSFFRAERGACSRSSEQNEEPVLVQRSERGAGSRSSEQNQERVLVQRSERGAGSRSSEQNEERVLVQRSERGVGSRSSEQNVERVLVPQSRTRSGSTQFAFNLKKINANILTEPLECCLLKSNMPTQCFFLL